MLKEDFVIQSNVRRILVRSNVDHTRMEFGTVRGVVYFRGIFRMTRIYTGGDDDDTNRDFKVHDFTVKSLASLEKKVKNIPGVSAVIFQFINWRKERGLWTNVETKRKKEMNYGREDDPAA
jgi:hypothetical protein